MRLSHEEKVERFYSHGTDIRSRQEGGFLSFGYWDDDTLDYEEAVLNLLERILANEKPLGNGSILNAACGYGAETFKIYEKLLPEKIIAIDITEPHINYARSVADKHNLSDRIHFEKMDACSIPYESGSFDYIIAIEGPAHFNTRERFLRKVYEVLKPGGVLLLSDIIVDNRVIYRNWLNRRIGKFCSKHWCMPEKNWMSIDELKSLLESIGFRRLSVNSIGEHVYPGFSRFNLKWKSFINAVRIRGLRLGIGLTFISWLLGFTYRMGMTDYAIIRAVRE